MLKLGLQKIVYSVFYCLSGLVQLLVEVALPLSPLLLGAQGRVRR